MTTVKIGNRKVGPGHPSLLVAEIGANHNQSFEHACELVYRAAAAGADAVKLQTLRSDQLTLDCDKPHFQMQTGPWAGRSLASLYRETEMPWEWQPKLKQLADALGMLLFSSPFSLEAIDFLEKEVDPPCVKIASFETTDHTLIRRAARTGKPLIISTGMATEKEIREAVEAANEGKRDRVLLDVNRALQLPCEIVLLKCTSAYPARPADANLAAIPYLARSFGGRSAFLGERLPVLAGLSDHTLGITLPVVAVTLGACVIEKHFTLRRSDGGPDAAFSLEPGEFQAMVDAVREAEAAMGEAVLGPTAQEEAMLPYRRSLFVVKDMKAGDVFTEENVRSIRPAAGLHTRHYREVLGKAAACDIERGTPLAWELVGF